MFEKNILEAICKIPDEESVLIMTYVKDLRNPLNKIWLTEWVGLQLQPTMSLGLPD